MLSQSNVIKTWMLLFIFGLVLFSSKNYADDLAFDECPSKAYLVQGADAKLYGVNLVTGQTTLLESDMGTGNKLNGFGFNTYDNFFYGWDYENQTIGKIGNDYQIVPQSLDNSQVLSNDGIDITANNYYVGDVAVTHNFYYFYKKNVGLFRVSLDPTDSNYLITETVTTSSPMNIYDLAFHPDSGLAFAVDGAGLLWKINVDDNTQTESLGNIGYSGTFGAAYFDVNGFLYVSRNSDGNIYRIDMNNIYSESQIDTSAFSPSVDGQSWSYNDYPPSSSSGTTNINGSSDNDVLIINGNLSASGFNYNGASGHDRLILGNSSSYYTVTPQGSNYRITWPNGNYLNTNNVEEILYDNFLSSSPSAETELFANGPISSTNDGARCAIAEIFDDDDTSVDFGDAPDSYSTTLASNGARHTIDQSGLFMGTVVNGENSPRSPSDSSDDGISFVTSLEIGLDAVLDIEASASGYVHGWIDFNQDGVFDHATENVLSGQLVAPGTNTLLIAIPNDSVSGSTWSRFRISSSDSVLPTGGEPDGEVEDYPVTLDATNITRVYYPSSSTYVTLAYEDYWPKFGDFDFNDVVVRYRTIEDRIDQNVVRYTAEGFLDASGAVYHNGFAVRFIGIDPNNVNTQTLRYEISGLAQTESPLELNYTDAILYIFPDIRDLYTASESCSVFRTQSGCGSPSPISFKATLPLSSPVNINSAPSGLLDPFIFGAKGHGHGESVNSEQARGWEVHMKNQAPTLAFSQALFGEEDDDSSGENYFQSANGLPWALEIPSSWLHPLEEVPINEAYPNFVGFAESNGATNTDWDSNYNTDKVMETGE